MEFDGPWCCSPRARVLVRRRTAEFAAEWWCAAGARGRRKLRPPAPPGGDGAGQGGGGAARPWWRGGARSGVAALAAVEHTAVHGASWCLLQGSWSEVLEAAARAGWARSGPQGRGTGVCRELARWLRCAVLVNLGWAWRELGGVPSRGDDGVWVVRSCLCGSWVDLDISAMLAKCCGGDRVVILDGAAPIQWEGMEVCSDSEEIPARTRSVLAATTPVGVVSLLGGVAKVCRHLPRSPSGLVVVFG